MFTKFRMSVTLYSTLLLVVTLQSCYCHIQQCCAPCDDFHQVHKNINSMFDNLSTLDECESYEFRTTPTSGTYDECRIMCLEMSGDLIQHNLGPQGKQYHPEIRKYVEANIENKFFWMGFHDKEENGVFRLLNGTLYDPTNENPDHLYNWDVATKQPTLEADQTCGCIYRFKDHDTFGMHDCGCTIVNPYDDVMYYGLCEIKNNKCL